MKNTNFLHELIDNIVERGRSLLEGGHDGAIGLDALMDLSRALMAGHGEFSGSLLARKIIRGYEALKEEDKTTFFHFLATEFVPEPQHLSQSAQAYLNDPSPEHLSQLATSVDSPRLEFFRRLNLTTQGTRALVAMRTDLIRALKSNPELAGVNTDLVHLFASWFNRGFLVLKRIDWSTSAEILEKIIQYEAVHEITGWDDLKRRLDPVDRRCFAFFHPALMDDPLIFVEVALSDHIPASIQDLLGEAAPEKSESPQVKSALPNTAVFYSISNCQKGLQGISFGNLLIKQVATDLAAEIPSLKTFVTLSPIPRFNSWLKSIRTQENLGALSETEIELLASLESDDWHENAELRGDLEKPLMYLAARYLLSASSAPNPALDPVARFHLSNGARLERINWAGDLSKAGIGKSCGIMVNYLYDLETVESNHETYANDGIIVASANVTKLQRS